MKTQEKIKKPAKRQERKRLVRDRILKALEGGSLCFRDLCKNTGLSTATLSRYSKRMVAEGTINRRTDPEDYRRTIYSSNSTTKQVTIEQFNTENAPGPCGVNIRTLSESLASKLGDSMFRFWLFSSDLPEAELNSVRKLVCCTLQTKGKKLESHMKVFRQLRDETLVLFAKNLLQTLLNAKEHDSPMLFKVGFSINIAVKGDLNRLVCTTSPEEYLEPILRMPPPPQAPKQSQG